MITLLYIDPGTGSMLFAILISVLGAVYFSLRTFALKLKFIFTGGKASQDNSHKLPFVIFSDDKRYWNVFKPVCIALCDKGMDIRYMTASPDDPALSFEYVHFTPEFIGKGNKAFAKLNFLNARILLSTTPGLDVYQWKRSKNVDYYVHILHAANEIAGYRMFGVDYYDALLLSGDYQVRDTRNLEALRNLPAKEIALVGLPYMDEMLKRKEAITVNEEKERTVLLAPSWGPSAIISKFGEYIIKALIKTGYHIIIRPHPQSFTSEREMLDALMEKYPASEKLEWNKDNDNFEVCNRSDILISDFSGVIFDYALVFDKPVIYADTNFDKSPYDAWWLDTPFWTLTAVPRLGEKLTEETLGNIKAIIDECIENSEYLKKRKEVRDETWVNIGHGTEATVDFLVNKYNELSKIPDSSSDSEVV